MLHRAFRLGVNFTGPEGPVLHGNLEICSHPQLHSYPMLLEVLATAPIVNPLPGMGDHLNDAGLPQRSGF